MSGPGFAVIDVETTGLFPGINHRVIEIAVVHVDDHGLITGSWETLLDPGRDLGPQHIHGVRAADVVGAPRFDRITRKLPEHAGPAEHADYLAMLDRALIDRHLSASEANGLVELAERLSIDRLTVAELHRRYFDDLARIAWADGELTESELADLVAVADLLDLPTDAISDAMDGPRWPAAEEAVAAVAGIFALRPGDLVVLTGEMTRPREHIEMELVARGFVPWSGVNKKVALVVAADPDSQSGKARKARDYGIPVVAERALWDLLAG